MRTYRFVVLVLVLTMLCLFVPAVGAEGGRDYILVKGDTLATVAKKLLGDEVYMIAIMEATNAKAETNTTYPKLRWTDQAQEGMQVYVPSQEEAEQSLAAYKARIMSEKDFMAKEWTIGFSNASETNNFRTAMRQALEELFQTRYPNVKLIRTDANDQPAKQLADLEDLLAQGVDALIISPVTTDVANPILDKAEAQGVPVIILDRQISGQNYTSLVATPFYDQALDFTKMVAEVMGGKGDLVIVEGLPGAGPAILHSQGYVDALANYPNIKVVARQAGNWSRQSGFEAMENILAAVPEFDGMIGDGSEMCVGQIDALVAAGWTEDQIKKLVIGGMDNYNGLMKLIKKGWVDVGYEHSPYDNGYSGGLAAILALRGAYLPKFWALQVGPITAENVDMFVAEDQPDDYWLLDPKILEERLRQPWILAAKTE